jgi:hypothetical protein
MRSVVNRTIGIVALAGAAFFGLATAASASVTVDSAGVGYVGKGDVQTALDWNNKAFDNGALSLKFATGASTAERINVDYPMVCMDVNTGAFTSGGHRLIMQPGTVGSTVKATPIYNEGNGKQITGFNLTATPGAFQAVGNAFVRDVTCGENTVLVFNEGTATQPKTVAVTGASTDGLTVNGVALPNTIG